MQVPMYHTCAKVLKLLEGLTLDVLHMILWFSQHENSMNSNSIIKKCLPSINNLSAPSGPNCFKGGYILHMPNIIPWLPT